MSLRNGHLAKSVIDLGRSRPELFAQAPSLIEQLFLRFLDLAAESAVRDLGGVEVIAPLLSLFRQAIQKRGHRLKRPFVRTEARKLRMMLVSPYGAFQDFLSKQCLPPGSNQSFRVKIARMQSP